MTLLRRFELTLCLVVLFFSGPLVIAQIPGTTPSSQEESPIDTGWPRVAKSGNLTVTLYQPQLQTWNQYTLKAYGAVLIESAGAESPTYGVYWFTAKSDVDKGARRVDFSDLEITKVSFPTAPDEAANYQRVLQGVVSSTSRSLSLDRLEADLARLQTDSKRSDAVLDNTPPRIIITSKPAILVYIDGDPTWREVEGTKYQHLINTTVLLLKAPSGVYFLHVFDGWMQALHPEGPWTVARTFPVELAQAEQQVLATRRVDLLTGKSESRPGKEGQDQTEQAAPSLAEGPVPEVYIVTSPTSLVVIDGEPDYKQIPGTNLFYVANTTGQIWVDGSNQNVYLLLAGRWFRAATSQGPWTHVTSASLPADFAKIPDDSPKEGVKASVSGTTQAREAVIANSIPQTAKVDKGTARMTPPQYDGEPQLKPIESTSLRYVANSSVPVIATRSDSYFAVENGVWFQASSLDGPWTVASTVPAEIYSIPATSPLYYVTFVEVYEADSDFVHVGYLPGYYGVYTDEDTVVYGTGYHYTPWIGDHWYGPAVTYGLGSNLTFTPWTGWAIGFGFGGGWGWGASPWWGPAGWRYRHGPEGDWGATGPAQWAATTGNVYHRWVDANAAIQGSRGLHPWGNEPWAEQVGKAYNSRTGAQAAGHRAAVDNVYHGDRDPVGATTARKEATTAKAAATSGIDVLRSNTGMSDVEVGNNIYADQGGGIYKFDDDGNWKQMDGSGNWGHAHSEPLDVARNNAQTPDRASLPDGGPSRARSDVPDTGAGGFANTGGYGNMGALDSQRGARMSGGARANGFSSGSFRSAGGGHGRAGGGRH
jgi:hypothetical protein